MVCSLQFVLLKNVWNILSMMHSYSLMWEKYVAAAEIYDQKSYVFVLKRSQSWRKLYGVHSISDCLGCFFGISPTTLEACYKSCLPHYDDALRECIVVCFHVSTLLNNGLILVFSSKGGISNCHAATPPPCPNPWFDSRSYESVVGVRRIVLR